jgi:hypothetical protein
MDKWNELYAAMDFNAIKHSDNVSYEKGFNWLKSCEIIEDWGCGTGGFKLKLTYFAEDIYI